MKKYGQLTFIILVIFTLTSCSSEAKVDVCEKPKDVTYSNKVASLIEEKCYSCHAPDVYKKKASRVKIFDYKSLKKQAEKGVLMGSVNHEKGYVAMPYKKGVKIDTCSRLVLQTWIDQGMKE